MDSFVNGIIMIVVGVIGLVPLIFVMLQLLCRYRLYPFQYLMLSKLVADGFNTMVPIMTFSASQLLFGNWLHKQNEVIVGYVALSLQYSSIYTSLAMTINRLIAVSSPQCYSKLFTLRRTLMCIAICWLTAWAHNTIHLKDSCRFTFDSQASRFKFSNEPCGQALSLYQDLVYNLTIAVITTLIDVYCLVQMAAYSPQRKNAEKPWFLQTAINAVLYVVMLVSFHIADRFEGTTVRFLLTVVAWQLWLASAPYIIICAEQEYLAPLRNLLKRRKVIGVLQRASSVM